MAGEGLHGRRGTEAQQAKRIGTSGGARTATWDGIRPVTMRELHPDVNQHRQAEAREVASRIAPHSLTRPASRPPKSITWK